MSIFPRIIVDKHCFVACPPERCNCKAGNRMAWVAQQAQFGLDADGNPLKAAKLESGMSLPNTAGQPNEQNDVVQEGKQ